MSDKVLTHQKRLEYTYGYFDTQTIILPDQIHGWCYSGATPILHPICYRLSHDSSDLIVTTKYTLYLKFKRLNELFRPLQNYE